MPAITALYAAFIGAISLLCAYRLRRFQDNLLVPPGYRSNVLGEAPFILLLMLLLELMSAHEAALHAVGVLLALGRFLQVRHLMRAVGKWKGDARVGTLLTWLALLVSAGLCGLLALSHLFPV